MTLRTTFTDRFGLTSPVALAPMGGSAGGALTAAVSNAGGLGLLGGGGGDQDWLDRELAAPVPVLAAGGIADGRGVAAALTLGAAGALVGTRFLATAEALIDPATQKAVLTAGGEDTERSSVLDIARGSRWPREYTGRTLGHPFLDEWRDREDELAANDSAKADYRRRAARGEFPPQPVWASQAVDLITDAPTAAEVLAALVAGAEDALNRALSG